MLELRNPHTVLATIQKRPRAVRSVRVNKERPSPAWDEVASVAAAAGITVHVGQESADRKGGNRKGADRKAGDRKGDRKGAGRRETERVGAGSANVEPPSPIPVGNLWKNKPKEGFGLWLGLDQVQDPQNLGAIFRLAGFFGVRGIVMTRDNTAPINATVCDISAGGVEHVPFSVVSNLAGGLKSARKADLWTLGTCERSKDDIRSVKLDRHWMLMLGNEGTGLRRLTRDSCDSLVAYPPQGEVESLNVATAAAACLAVLSLTR